MEEKDPKADYKYIKELSKGSFGTVFLVVNKKTGKLTVIKKIAKEMFDTIEPIEVEINALLVLSKYCQEYTVCYHKSFDYDKHIYIVMDYLKGPTMEQLIYQTTPQYRLKLDPEHKMIKHLITGLNSLLKMGVANQDIKLANIMYDSLTQDIEKPRFIDWGLACIQNGSQYFCGVIGTEYTAPPELDFDMNHTHEHDSFTLAMAHDIWSLGIVIYSWYILDKNVSPTSYYYTQFQRESYQKSIKQILNDISPYNMTQQEINDNIERYISDIFGKKICKLLLTRNIAQRLTNFFNIQNILQ